MIVSTAIADNGEVVLRVRDTGIGMSEKDLATALEPFRQVATTTRARSGGTGLGLPLTKALAEANHATLQDQEHAERGDAGRDRVPRRALAGGAVVGDEGRVTIVRWRSRR